MYDDIIAGVLFAIVVIVGIVLIGIDEQNRRESENERLDTCVSAGMEFVDGDCVDK